MKPQQQDMEAKKESHVYVQKPDGEEINIEKSQSQADENPEDATQTAANTPTTASGEVTDGEAG
jgi:hypothetical protein